MAGPVALTGATGFIGRNIAEQLIAEGHAVRALTRRPQVERAGLTWIRGDLEDPLSLASLVAGTVAVIHCAGAVRGAGAGHFQHVNRDGTRAVTAAALQSAPTSRFLLISSLAARQPALSWYADSKRAAELVLEGEARLQWTIFRPPAVYGPGDREILPLFQAMRRGWLPVVGPPGARFSLLHVSDLAGAVSAWLAADASRLAWQTFELDDGMPQGYDWNAVRELAQHAWGRTIRSVPVPLAVVRSAAWINLALARATGRAPMLTPGKVRELSHANWVCDNARIMQNLGWKPEIRLADALARPAIVGL